MKRRGIGGLLAATAVWLSVIAPVLASAQGTLSALETDVDQIARAGRPSVVTVFAQRTVDRPKVRPGQPTKRLHTRVGSGVAVDEHEVLTTASVVYAAERVRIRTSNGLQSDAEVVGMDPISNLALLRVSDVRLPAIKLSADRSAQEGEWVMAIGTSHFRTQLSQSVGSIAYRHREPRMSLLQLTNTVYPGYSGGAVLNARGELIGIVQGELGSPERAAPGMRPGGMSFVLPVEHVKPILASLRAEGLVHHGYLGVSTRAASVESETERGVQVPIGALVEAVQQNGPAARIGLRRGDLIVAFERERVEYPEQLARWVAATPPGTAVELVWVRDELQRSGRIALSESPDPIPQWALLAPSVGEGALDPSSPRIADIERQIQKLNRELERLKGQSNR